MRGIAHAPTAYRLNSEPFRPRFRSQYCVVLIRHQMSEYVDTASLRLDMNFFASRLCQRVNQIAPSFRV